MSSRRDFVKSVAFTAAAAAGGSSEAQTPRTPVGGRPPNIILYVADQFRCDFVRANRLNPTVQTPNLDRIAARGASFTGAVTNQPLCCPARSVFLTGRYATETGVWHNDGPPLDQSLPTLASVLRGAGYTANFIGKWHLGFQGNSKIMSGWIPPDLRGGFLDLWEGANQIENTTHPYEGTIWQADGTPLVYHDQYRADFLTDRAVRFLRQQHDKPFLLYVSQLEPHFQNDQKRTVAPRGYAEQFEDPFVPGDLRPFPGIWQSELPAYYGAIKAIDESIGRILDTLEAQGVLDNTIFLFTSDHGDHFETRDRDAKRTPHNSSIRVPFVIQGPGFDQSMSLPQVFGTICLTPTLLQAAGVPVPSSMKGISVLPLLHSADARKHWKNEALIQISESRVARAIRTDEWCYCATDFSLRGRTVERGTHYVEEFMYNEFADPHELINLAGRREFTDHANALRERLKQLVVASGEPEPDIVRPDFDEVPPNFSPRDNNREW